MVVVNNWRVMHGRESCVGTRNLLGAYMDWDEMASRARLHGLHPPAIYV